MNTQAPAILLIEKDKLTLEIYQRELSKSFTVFAFIEIIGAREILATHDIKAVIIEPEIEGGQGWDLIDSLPIDFPEYSSPVIVCSTRDPSSENLAKDITIYLTKPVLPKTLREKTLFVLGLKDKQLKSS